MAVTRRCLECNCEFKTRQVYVNRGQGKFCSLSCSSRFGNKQRKRSSETVQCSQCEKQLFRKKSIITKHSDFFCGRECKGNYESTKPALCLNCDKPIKGQNKFCNSNCWRRFLFEQYILKWKNGEVDGNTKDTISAHIRRYLFEKHDNKCQKCGWGMVNKSNNRIPLTVNHISGNWRDSRPENLELICPNCHSLTPTYGSLNMGNGRLARRNRYVKKNGE